MKNRPLWQKIWIASFMGCIVYYIVKTLVLQYPSILADSFVMVYGTVSLVIFLYFFPKKKDEK